jgi:hypothetical protein
MSCKFKALKNVNLIFFILGKNPEVYAEEEKNENCPGNKKRQS